MAVSKWTCGSSSLGLLPEIEPAALEGGVVVVCSSVRPLIGFVDTKLIDKPYYLPLAVSGGNGQIGQRTFVECISLHPVIELLIKCPKLEQTVWQAGEGGVWTE